MAHEIEKQLDDHLAPNKRFDMALDHGSVTATDVEAESIGVSAEAIDYRCHPNAAGPPPRQIAERLVEQVNYMQEPLAIIEDDLEGSATQVRSARPQAHPDGARYYELVAEPGHISVRRYQRQTDGERKSIPMRFTRETFGRLCRDLDDSVSTD
ncbi:MAG: hypothetical protein WDZ51_19470 [Pirellulaceae bacterium]